MRVLTKAGVYEISSIEYECRDKSNRLLTLK